MTDIEQLPEKILEEAASLYALTGKRWPTSGGFENWVYEYTAPHGNVIIRLTPCVPDTPDMLSSIKAEVNFIRYLHRNGAPVPKVIPSIHGKIIEKIHSSSLEYAVVATKKVQGAPATTISASQWTPSLIAALGTLMGTLHVLALSYIPPKGVCRPSWNQDAFYYPERFIPHQSLIVEKSQSLLEHISSLPKDPLYYGLIHADINLNNLYVHNGTLTVLDFDDSRYGWFAHDIAVALFFWLMDLHIQDRESAAQIFLDNFIAGYETVYTLDPYWLQQIPLFLDLQVMLCYTVIMAEDDLNHLNAWCQRFMEGRKSDIEEGIPFVSLENWFVKREISLEER